MAIQPSPPLQPFVLTQLPYEYDALEPAISSDALHQHHDKHHAGYVRKANALATELGLTHLAPLQIIRHAKDSGLAALFSNSAQAWNHDFYWHSLTSQFSAPSELLLTAVRRDFGSMQGLKDVLVDSGEKRFGSGWVWLCVSEKGHLAVESTGNAESPAFASRQCLLAIDVWEHAYYLDYRSERRRYLECVVGAHLSWQMASAKLAASVSRDHFGSEFTESPGILKVASTVRS